MGGLDSLALWDVIHMYIYIYICMYRFLKPHIIIGCRLSLVTLTVFTPISMYSLQRLLVTPFLFIPLHPHTVSIFLAMMWGVLKRSASGST